LGTLLSFRDRTDRGTIDLLQIHLCPFSFIWEKIGIDLIFILLLPYKFYHDASTNEFDKFSDKIGRELSDIPLMSKKHEKVVCSSLGITQLLIVNAFSSMSFFKQNGHVIIYKLFFQLSVI
jgi:hypothetical protein